MAVGSRTLPCLIVALAMAACGGGGGTPEPGPDPTVATPVAGGDGPLPGGGSTSQPIESQPRIESYERTEAMAAKGLQPSKALLKSRRQLEPVRLGPLTPDQLQAKSIALSAPSLAGRPLQIGLGRVIAKTDRTAGTAWPLDWQRTASGTWIGAASFQSDGAAGVRLGLRVHRLPEGAVVFVYPGSGGEAAVVGAETIVAAIERNVRAGDASEAGRTYWLPAVAGDQASLEIELPAGRAPESVELAIPQLSHLWWTHAGVSKADGLKIGTSGSCNLDATCSDEYAEPSRSIARLEYVSNATTYLCSGTLMADTERSGTPYLLTANHCIGTQTVASSLTTYWFYRASSCGSATLDPRASQRLGGATLVYASGATDTTLLSLLQSPPSGTVHAGSLLGATAVGTPLAGLHHPQGDRLKLSLGANQAYATCVSYGCYPEGDTGGNFISVRWSSGTTEGGSSGSPLFASVGNQRYVVGQLFGGSASCNQPHLPDYYGRFDKAYPALRVSLGGP